MHSDLYPLKLSVAKCHNWKPESHQCKSSIVILHLKFLFFLKACSCHGEDGNKKKIRILLQFKQITNWVPEKIMATSSKIWEGASKQAGKLASQPASHKSWSSYSPWYKLTEEKEVNEMFLLASSTPGYSFFVLENRDIFCVCMKPPLSSLWLSGSLVSLPRTELTTRRLFSVQKATHDGPI